MKPDVTSRHLRTSTELTLIAPIKQGFIEYVDTITYASRLRTLLSMFFELRKAADERSSGAGAGGKQLEYVGPLEKLQTLHFVQWAIIDNDTRLMLNVTFDRSWESYIRDIVDVAGPLLDIILCHCAGYEGHSTNLGYDKFAEWVREHQVKNDFFYAAEPSLTSDDHRYQIELAEQPANILEERAARAAKGALKPEEQSAALGLELEKKLAHLRLTTRKQSGGNEIDLMRIGGALFDVRRYFAGVTGDGVASYLSASARQDLTFYDEIAFLMLAGFALDKLDAEKAKQVPLLKWCADLPRRSRARPHEATAPIPKEDVAKIQRGLLTPYEKATHGCLVMLRWASAAEGAAFLEHMARRVAFEGGGCPEHTISLALTLSGLRALDLTADELQGFPKEFREGMEARSGILGDIKASHPSTWRLPKANWVEPGASFEGEPETIALGSVHAVLVMQTDAPTSGGDFRWSGSHPLAHVVQEIAHATGVDVLHVQALRREYVGGAMIEHFGYRDDISQPHVAFEGGGKLPLLARDRVAPGEIVLGHPNTRGETIRYTVGGAAVPAQQDLLRNGSFLVLRKLKQDVSAFQSFLKDGAAALGVAPEVLAEQIMGRGRSLDDDGKPIGKADGAPLADITLDPSDDTTIAGMREQQALNSFNFADSGCPFHAHIRRVNPRDELPPPKPGDPPAKTPDSNTPQLKTPRILRRSFPYGPPRGAQSEHGDEERGLMFMAFNAGIADQYEILQRWISGGNSTGLPSSLADLISGASSAATFPVYLGSEVRWLAAPEKALVELQWGMYTFVPSRDALALLAERAKRASGALTTAQQTVARGVVLVNKLLALPDATAKVEWKRVLENREAAEDTRAVWAAVLMAYNGALRTPYGVLVAGEANVYAVLRDSHTYSVREYWHRMSDSIGPMHLGMDPEPQAMPEKIASAKDRAYEDAIKAGTYDGIAGPLNKHIAGISEAKSFEGARAVTAEVLRAFERPQSVLATCDLRDVAGLVMQNVSKAVFGVPDPSATPASTMADFRQCSVYVFSVNPERWVAEGAREAGAALRTADPGMKGAAFGFLAATAGSLVNTLFQWLDSGALWHVQQDLLTLRESEPDPEHLEADRKMLSAVILAAMQRAPAPGVLHRQVVRPARLGAVSLVPGDRVVAGLATVPAQNSEDVSVMFGGDYGADGAPVHACPGRAMAIGVMTGFMWTLLRQRDIRRVSEINPLKITFEPRL